MKTFLRHLWEKLRVSFWFTPGLWVLGAIAAAQGMLVIDGAAHLRLAESFPELTRASPEGVRSLLATIATSVLTLAGLAFSATLVALSLASAQFGPRLLRNFIRSRTNQITLAILLGTFVFALVVLRSTADEFIPHLSAFAAFLLALCGLGAFIVFVHSIVSSMRAEKVVADVYGELDQALDRSFPDALPSDEEERNAETDGEDWDDSSEEISVGPKRGGYLQAVDLDTLIDFAREHDIRLRVVKRPGQFVSFSEDLIAFPEEQELGESARQELRSCFLIGDQRTPEQDFEFSVRQLVEVALRALSPGINDPFTAMNCIDFLSESLTTIARRRLPRRVFSDSEGTARVWTRPASFESLLETAFHQLRQASAGKTDVTIRLLEGFERIARAAVIGEQKETLLEHAEMIAKMGERDASTGSDRDAIEARWKRVQAQCAG